MNGDDNHSYCPLFVKYVRKCIDNIQMVSEVYTITFCAGGLYKDCPFYRTVNKIGDTCEMIDWCQIYKSLSLDNFKEFLSVTNGYCLSSNNVNCKRYQAKKRGEIPPPDLMPY